MTRGQFSLMGDESGETAKAEAAVNIVAQRPQHLKVLTASAEETAAHEAYLDGLDKAVGGSCVWREAAGETS